MAASSNPALTVRGPAVLVMRGVTIHSQDTIQVEPRLGTFSLDSSEAGELEKRELNFNFSFQFTPYLALASASRLYPYANRHVGELAHLVEIVSAINTGTNQLTVTAHRFRPGHPVKPATFGTLPAVLTGARVYVRIVDANTITLHPTEADALANTNPLDFADAGVGELRLIEEEPITLWSLRDRRGYTFHNHIIEQQPDFQLAGNRAAFGRMTVSAMRQHAIDPTNAAAFYTPITVAPTYDNLNPADIATLSLAGAWGAVAPWSAFRTEDGLRLSAAVQLSDDNEDGSGVLSRIIDARSAELRCRPRGVSDADALAKLTAQGAGAGQGRRITGDDLNFSVAGAYARLYKASLVNAPLAWARNENRLGECTWQANQAFAAGVPDPLFFIGTAAPA